MLNSQDLPAGTYCSFRILLNESFVGAKTVNGPALLRVSTNPAAVTAATSVV